jgi:hypothetical protein
LITADWDGSDFASFLFVSWELIDEEFIFDENRVKLFTSKSSEGSLVYL